MPEVTDLRILDNEDQPELEAFLEPRRSSSLFLLSNSRQFGLEDQGERLQGRYVAAFRQGRMVGVIGHFRNQAWIVQAPPEVLPELVSFLRSSPSGLGLDKVLGPAEQVQVVLSLLEVEPAQLQLDSNEVLYRLVLLELQVPPALLEGQVRVRHALEEDRPVLIPWRHDYQVEALDDPPGVALREEARQGVERGLVGRDLYVLERGGSLVATSSFNAQIDEVVQIGGVWTPPEERSQGYGRAVVAGSLLEARDRGVEEAVLFTPVSNQAARRAYESLGFREVGDYRIAISSGDFLLETRS